MTEQGPPADGALAELRTRLVSIEDGLECQAAIRLENGNWTVELTDRFGSIIVCDESLLEAIARSERIMREMQEYD